MEVGQFVRHTPSNRIVQVTTIDLANNAATVTTISPATTFPCTILELSTNLKPTTATPTHHSPGVNTEGSHLTPAQQKRIKFNEALFSDTGVTISCKCGHVTKTIPQVYIATWSNENAAINYVTSLCGHCRPEPPTFNQATKRYFPLNTGGTIDSND